MNVDKANAIRSLINTPKYNSFREKEKTMTVASVNETFSYSISDKVNAFRNFREMARNTEGNAKAFWTDKAVSAFQAR